MDQLFEILQRTGFLHITWGNVLMWAVSMVFLFLAVKKEFEPLLLVPISFGILLANIPLADFMKEGHFLWVFYNFTISKWDQIGRAHV